MHADIVARHVAQILLRVKPEESGSSRKFHHQIVVHGNSYRIELTVLRKTDLDKLNWYVLITAFLFYRTVIN